MDKKFFYKAQRIDNREWVEGRVGHPYIIEGGVSIADVEKETYFFSYNERRKKQWSSCIVKTDTIAPLN